jgi:hypothetical protein
VPETPGDFEFLLTHHVVSGSDHAWLETSRAERLASYPRRKREVILGLFLNRTLCEPDSTGNRPHRVCGVVETWRCDSCPSRSLLRLRDMLESLVASDTWTTSASPIRSMVPLHTRPSVWGDASHSRTIKAIAPDHEGGARLSGVLATTGVWMRVNRPLFVMPPPWTVAWFRITVLLPRPSVPRL